MKDYPKSFYELVCYLLVFFSPVYLLWAFLKAIGMIGIATISLVWITTDIAILTSRRDLIMKYKVGSGWNFYRYEVINYYSGDFSSLKSEKKENLIC